MSIIAITFAIGACTAISGNQLQCGKQTIDLARVDEAYNRRYDNLAKEHLNTLIDGYRVICTFSKNIKTRHLSEAECSADFTPSLNNEMIEWRKR